MRPSGILDREVRPGRRMIDEIDALGDAGDSAAAAAYLMALAPEERLRALADYLGSPNAMNATYLVSDGGLDCLRDLRSTVRAWLPEWLDWKLEQRAALVYMPAILRLPFFVALARSGQPLEPRWDAAFPLVLDPAHRPYTLECIRALPSDRRTAVVLGALSGWGSSDKSFVELAILLLPDCPWPELARAALERAPKVHPLTRKGLTAALRALAPAHPEIAVLVTSARASAPKPVRLAVESVRAPRSFDALSRIEREQLRVAGAKWDGRDVPAAERFAEDAIGPTLEIRTITDAGGTPAYDALLFAGDSGSVFRSGTTEEVGALVQNHLELANDTLRSALLVALRARPKRAAGTVKKSVAGKPSAKRPAAKKPPKKPAARKPPAKKPAAKKPRAETAIRGTKRAARAK